jgi:hypothetical protein
MSVSSFHLLPPFKEETDFLLTTDQGCESSGLCHIQATGGTTLTKHMIDVYGLDDTTQGLCSQVLALKITLYQAIRRFTDSNRIGSCQSLNSRCHIGCLAQSKLLLSPTLSHGTDHDQTRMDTHTQSKLDTFLLLQTSIEVSQGS